MRRGNLTCIAAKILSTLNSAILLRRMSDFKMLPVLPTHPVETYNPPQSHSKSPKSLSPEGRGTKAVQTPET